MGRGVSSVWVLPDCSQWLAAQGVSSSDVACGDLSERRQADSGIPQLRADGAMVTTHFLSLMTDSRSGGRSPERCSRDIFGETGGSPGWRPVSQLPRTAGVWMGTERRPGSHLHLGTQGPMLGQEPGK